MGQDMSLEEEEKFYYRHKIEVHLSLVCIDSLDNTKARFAVAEENQTISLPYIKLKAGESVSSAIRRLFKRCVGSDSDWFVLKQIGVVDASMTESDTVIVLYSVTIPYIVPLVDKKTRWIDYSELSLHRHIFELTSLACNYNRMN